MMNPAYIINPKLTTDELRHYIEEYSDKTQSLNLCLFYMDERIESLEQGQRHDMLSAIDDYHVMRQELAKKLFSQDKDNA